jgi:LmbE family N-acetylglucosaminyl deacetylase
MLSDSEVQRVLVIAAHPDDVDFGAAGTVARWTDSGLEVVYCVVTDGDAGGYDEGVPRSEIAPLRRAEQTAAAKLVGVTDIRFLGYPDGRVEATLGLRRDLARVIRQVRPERVVCPSPERNYLRMGISHPDHRAVGLQAWKVSEVWIPGGQAPNHYVDITETFDRKIAALRAHASQTGHRPDLAEFLRGWLGRAAAQGGLPPGRLAEVFQVVETG